MSKTIYLVRHGQTDFNKRGIIQGSGVDSSLNDLGKMQADAFFDAYQHIPFEKIYISGLKRTQESVKGFIELGIPYKSMLGLNEIGWGNTDGVYVEKNDKYWGSLEEWKRGNVGFHIPGAESPLDVQKRLIESMGEIMAAKDEKLILICMHGRAMRILLSTLLDHPLHEMDYFVHHNLGLYKLQYAEEKFEVELFNDLKHLEEKQLVNY